MSVNRVVTRAEALRMNLASRVRLESAITNAMERHVTTPVIPREWSFAKYIQLNPGRRFMFSFLGPLEGKTVLDLGCGYHPTPIYFALAGAEKVWACDVSYKALAFIRRIAHQANVSDKIETVLAPAERLPLPSDHVDRVHGQAVLHHLDLDLAAAQIQRDLKPGGRAAFADPLGHNFLLEVARDYLPYRWKHPAKGTDRPMRYRDIRRFARHFRYSKYRGFGVLILAVMAVTRRRNGTWLHRAAHRADECVLTVMPWLRRFGRFVVTCVEK